MFHGVNGGLDAAVEAKFAQEVLDVDFDGTFCNIKGAGDFLVTFSTSEVMQNFTFSGGEFVVFSDCYGCGGGGRGGGAYSRHLRRKVSGADAREELGHHLRRKDGFALGGADDGGHQGVGIDVFEQVATGTGAQAVEQVIDFFRNSEHEDVQAGCFGKNPAGSFATRESWHVVVEQDDIGAVLNGKANAEVTITGFSNDLEVGRAFEQGAQATAEEGVVVDEQDADGGGCHGVSILRVRESCNRTSVPCSGVDWMVS